MASILVKGMMCQHCLGAVQKAMEAVENAGEVNVDLSSGVAEWSGTASVQAMIDAVVAQGYEAKAN